MSRAFFFSVLALLSLGGLAQESGQGTQPTPQTEQMQTRMQAMREQMARIHATEDPEERQRLMQEHMRSMHEGMMMMGRMMGGPGAQEPMRQCQEGDTECRMSQMQMQQQMMGQRMGMMQQMMEQMMEQMMQGGASDTPEATPEGESQEEHH